MSEEEFKNITAFLDDRSVSQSKFFRLAVKEKIDRINNPQANSYLNPEVMRELKKLNSKMDALNKEIKDRDTLIDGLKSQLEDDEEPSEDDVLEVKNFYHDFIQDHKRREDSGVKTSEFMKGTHGIEQRKLLKILTTHFKNIKGGWFLIE